MGKRTLLCHKSKEARSGQILFLKDREYNVLDETEDAYQIRDETGEKVLIKKGKDWRGGPGESYKTWFKLK